jgi:hypothetical protein
VLWYKAAARWLTRVAVDNQRFVIYAIQRNPFLSSLFLMEL